MADIRIKDITTTASASLTGDFLPIDGSTGTRKLSAFSPTFGGNATVTGTLTVNGVATAGSYLTSAAGLTFPGALSANGYYLYSGSANGLTMYGYGSTYDVYIGNRAGTRALSVAANSTVVSIPDTTASTTTSTGALVVGNGTSGGLGVGGSIVLGANLVSTASDGKIQVNGTGNTTGNKELTFQRSDAADSFAVGLTGSAYAGALTGLGNNEAYLYNSSASAFRVFIGTAATNRFDFTSTQFKINATTASTSTSSGALVVSGGVGVAGAIYAGGDLTVDKTEPTITFKRAANTNLNIVNFWTGAFADFGIGLRNTTDSDLHIYNYGTSNDALKIAKADSLATFGAAIRTAAPSGGTAANWKLGTVATVSPTSPNRTIEVDIGGTIYYLAAKTTNN